MGIRIRLTLLIHVVDGECRTVGHNICGIHEQIMMDNSEVQDSRFARRACPCCRGIDAKPVFDLKAESFCQANWSYAASWAATLGIDPVARFPIQKCKACGFLYAGLEPSRDFLSDLYEKVIMHELNREANENAGSFSARMRYVADLLDLAPKRKRLKALDFGCGVGATLRLLSDAGVKAIGFDNSDIRIGYVQNMGMQVVGDPTVLKELGPFDIIVCDNVLEHLPDPVEAVRLFASVSVPGASVYVSVPNADDAFIVAQQRAVAIGCSVDMSLNPWEHLNYFDLYHLDRLLEIGGFRPIRSLSLPGSVDIGLRPETGFVRRLTNALMSTGRLARYAATGNGVRNPNRAFYRYVG